MAEFFDSGMAEFAMASIALLTAVANVYTYIATGKQTDHLIDTVHEQVKDNSKNFGEMSRHLRKSQSQLDQLIKKLPNRM